MKKIEKNLCDVKITSNDASIEDFYGQVKIDFANKYIGGGSLTDGNVQ